MGISRTIAKFIIGEIISFSIGAIIRWRVSVGNFDRASRRKQILGGRDLYKGELSLWWVL